MKKTQIDLQKLKKLSISLEEFDQKFSPEEKKQIEQETQNLRVLIGLREARKTQKITQAEMARRSKIPRATITKIENGQRNATIKTMLSLANAMGKKLQISWV